MGMGTGMVAAMPPSRQIVGRWGWAVPLPLPLPVQGRPRRGMCIDVQAVVVAEPLLFSGGGVDVRDSPMHARSSRPAQRRLSAESPTTATRRTRRGRHRVGGRLGDGGVGDVRQLILDDLRHPPQPAWPPGFRTCVWITGVGDRKESGSFPVPVRHLGLRRHRRVELGEPTTRRSNRPVSPRPRLGPRLLDGCTHASAPPQPGDSSPGTPPADPAGHNLITAKH